MYIIEIYNEIGTVDHMVFIYSIRRLASAVLHPTK